jgi:4-amino-4-deoxy-L-arabinose transferase-like glycosyltransferase
MSDSGGWPKGTRAIVGWRRSDTALVILVTLIALLVRLPYWRTIPRAGDEVGQAVYAFKIAQGHNLPLVGNDAYAGPFFFYLLALLFRAGVSDPFAGRMVVLVSGALTATVTYAWVRRMQGNHVAAPVAALLVAVNPHLVLLSRLGGTTFMMPFFTTGFLWLVCAAVDRDRPGCLLLAALAAGLAIQSNPVAALLIATGLVWAALRMRGASRLGWYWPAWPVVAGLCVLLVYSPVVIYNLTADLSSAEDASLRSYLWQAEPTIHTFLVNAQRLGLQLVRQVGGVLVGDETLSTVLGWPLLYAAWMLAGLVVTTRKVSVLPLLVIMPFLIVFPYFSGHYGMIYPVRFTSLLTPVFAACMGFLAATVVKHIKSSGPSWVRGVAIAIALVAALLMAGQPVLLAQYYDLARAQNLDGHILLTLCLEMVEVNQGERVFVSHTGRMMQIKGIPYVPHSHLLFADIQQEFLPPEQIIGRLYEVGGPAMLLLDDRSAAVVGQIADLTPWPSVANEEARELGYGLYTLSDGAPLIKPDHVLVGEEAQAIEPQVRVGTVLGGGVELVGYDGLASVTPGETLVLTVYWRPIAPLPQGTYVGFIHLSDPSSALAAQDDHLLGGERYPLGAWQPGETVVEQYVLPLAADAVVGQYAFRAGIYTWPDLARLEVPGHADNVVELGVVDVEARP